MVTSNCSKVKTKISTEKRLLVSYGVICWWKMTLMFLLIFIDKKFSSMNIKEITGENQLMKKMG
jgi:hypothetical protein